MQFDPQIDTERDRLNEIVKMKNAWRGIKVLRINWFQPFQTFHSGLSAFKAFNRYAQFKSFKTSEDQI